MSSAKKAPFSNGTSSFSGFASKANEEYYDRLVFKLIQLLSYKVL